MNAADLVSRLKEWINKLPKLDINKLVFLDESGVNTNTTRIYGRSLEGSRCVDKAPLTAKYNNFIVGTFKRRGAFTTYQGGTTCERFTDYLKNVLAPTLKSDDIVVMDNMHAHHSNSRTTFECLLAYVRTAQDRVSKAMDSAFGFLQKENRNT